MDKNRPTIEELELGVSIDRHKLEEACAIQPDAFYKVARALAMDMSMRDALVQALKEEEARADSEIRENAEAHRQKYTDKAVEAMKVLDPDVVRVRRQLQQHNARVHQLTALKESFLQRGYALKELVALHLGNYYSDIEHSQSSFKDVRAGKVRSDMKQMRRVHRETN
jgi:hypothetical protein